MNANLNQLADFVVAVNGKIIAFGLQLLRIFHNKEDAARQQELNRQLELKVDRQLQSLKVIVDRRLQSLEDEFDRQLQAFKVGSDRRIKSLKDENALLKKLLEEKGRKLEVSQRVIGTLQNQVAALNQPARRSRSNAMVVKPTISFEDKNIKATSEILLRAYPLLTQANLRAFCCVEECKDMYTWTQKEIDFVCSVLKDTVVIGCQRTKGTIWNERCRFICYCLGIEFVPHPKKTLPKPW